MDIKAKKYVVGLTGKADVAGVIDDIFNPIGGDVRYILASNPHIAAERWCHRYGEFFGNEEWETLGVVEVDDGGMPLSRPYSFTVDIDREVTYHLHANGEVSDV